MTEKLKKAEFIAALADRAGVSKSQAEQVHDALFEELAQTLREGKSINLQGFGTFEPVERAARQGRNPQTGEAVTIPAKRSAKFKPAQALKDL
jgi:DNA-binding protein HU-beta